MEDKRTFKRYNFVTGVVDGTLAYDFSAPQFMPQEEAAEYPDVRRRPRRTARRLPRRQEWVREEPEELVGEVAQTAARSHAFGILLASTGAIAAVVLLVMVLLAQISLLDISAESVSLEAQISELETVNNQLTVQYETIFNLKDVEEYATGVLGMQEAREDQIYYLSGVSSADKAVILNTSDTGLFSVGIDDLLAPVLEYFS